MSDSDDAPKSWDWRTAVAPGVQAGVAGDSQRLSVLEAVMQLDRILTQLLGHVDVLREAPAPEVIESVVRLGPAVIAAVRLVREQTLVDSTDPQIESIEDTLRARAAVVMMGLDELRAAEHELAATPLVIGGRFRSAAELSRVLTERIGRINASLARKHRDLGGAAVDQRRWRALFRVALDNAAYGYTALGSDPDVLAFLRGGAACESKRIRIACRTIASALEATVVEHRPRSATRSMDGHGRSFVRRPR